MITVDRNELLQPIDRCSAARLAWTAAFGEAVVAAAADTLALGMFSASAVALCPRVSASVAALRPSASLAPASVPAAISAWITAGWSP